VQVIKVSKSVTSAIPLSRLSLSHFQAAHKTLQSTSNSMNILHVTGLDDWSASDVEVLMG